MLYWENENSGFVTMNPKILASSMTDSELAQEFTFLSGLLSTTLGNGNFWNNNIDILTLDIENILREIRIRTVQAQVS